MGAKTRNWRAVADTIQRVRTAKGRAFAGYFSLEGIRLHERALRATVPIAHVLIAHSVQQSPSPRLEALLDQLDQTNCQIHVAPDAAIETLTQGRDLGGILGLVRLPKPLSLSDLSLSDGRFPLLVAVDVVDPGNLGALVRTAHAFGAAAFVGVGVSDPYHPKAVRTSMGSLFKAPVLHYDNVASLLADLKRLGWQTVGTVAEGGVPLPQMPPITRNTAVFVGSEYWGLPDVVSSQLDLLLTIPMAPGIDSFSVNAATAVVLYQWQQVNQPS